jgi:hypothetical protein
MSTESRYSHEYRYRDHRQSSKKAKVAVAEDVRFSSRGGVKTNRSKLRTGGDGRNDRDVYCYFNHLRSSKETNIVEDVRRLASGESSRSVVGVSEGAKGFIAKAFVASLCVYALIATFNYSSILVRFSLDMILEVHDGDGLRHDQQTATTTNLTPSSFSLPLPNHSNHFMDRLQIEILKRFTVRQV